MSIFESVKKKFEEEYPGVPVVEIPDGFQLQDRPVHWAVIERELGVKHVGGYCFKWIKDGKVVGERPKITQATVPATPEPLESIAKLLFSYQSCPKSEKIRMLGRCIRHLEGVRKELKEKNNETRIH